MAGLTVVWCLEMDVDIAVTRRKDAAVPGRVKADNRSLDFRQLEFDLDLLVHLHIVRCVADAIEDVD